MKHIRRTFLKDIRQEKLFNFSKKTVVLVFSIFSLCFAQEIEVTEVQNVSNDSESEKTVVNLEFEAYPEDISSIIVEIPEPKRPKPVDAEAIAKAEKRDIDKEEFNEKKLAIKYGTPSEINGVIDKIVEEEDPRFNDDLYDLFYQNNSNEIKGRLLEYFSKLKDPCLEDYAVEVLDDPYDLPNSVVEKALNYVNQVESKAAAPALVKLLESGEEQYFNGSLSALGACGGPKEALYLADYINRDDLETPQKQALMRTLGKMNAVQTFDKVVEIAQNEDENAFVRMYAAEAIGNMKKEEAIPVLLELFEHGDPNMRQYCIKGLSNFPESEKAQNAIIQGIRDSHYKVRIEAIKTVQKTKMTSAMDFLTYRAKNDNENAVKKECYPVIAELNTKEGNDFLLSQITEKKVPDSVKSQVAEALMKNGTFGETELVELAKEACNDDRRKPLRYALGKLIPKYARPAYAEVCALYVQSKDAQTVSLGLDMYKAAKYESAVGVIKELAEDPKPKNTGNKKRARKLLGLEEEEEKPSPSVDAK